MSFSAVPTINKKKLLPPTLFDAHFLKESFSFTFCPFFFLSLSFSPSLFHTLSLSLFHTLSLTFSPCLSFSFSLDSNTFTQSAVSNRLIFSYFVTNTKFLATIFPSRSSIHCSLSLLHTQTTIHTLSLSLSICSLFFSVITSRQEGTIFATALFCHSWLSSAIS